MKKRIEHWYLILLLLLFFTFAAGLNILIKEEQQFVFLAKSFLQGKLYFTQQPGNWFDSVYKNGHYYWHLGPAPAIILLPFIVIAGAFHVEIYQGYLQIFFTAGIFYFAYKLARRYKFPKRDSLFLAFAFCFASPYIIVALMPWGWYFVQAIAVFFLFAAIAEWHGKKRHWVIGLCFAVIAASRFTSAFGLIFFVGDIIWNRKKKSYRQILNELAQLLLPSAAVIGGLLWYNYARFGNMLDNGYIDSNNKTMKPSERFEQLNYGLFQLRNIPTNIYWYFINTISPVRIQHFSVGGQSYILEAPYMTVKYPGVGFFTSSPTFLFLVNGIRRHYKDRVVKLSLIASCVILFLLMTYYWTGWRQVGPRYMLDLQPFLYVILLHSFKNRKLPTFAKILIGISALFNLYFLFIVLVTPQ